MGVPSATAFQISAFVTAIRPSVQSFARCVFRRAVHHDLAARRHALCGGPRPVLIVRVGDVQRAVELALGIVAMGNVGAFRGLVVALLPLGSNRVSAERDLLSLEQLVSAHQRERSFFFQDVHAVSPGIRRQPIFSRRWYREKRHPNSKQVAVHDADYSHPSGMPNARL